MPFDDAGFGQRESDLAVLREARAGIARPGGWCKFRLKRGAAHCAIGWMAVANGGSDHSFLGVGGWELIKRTLLPLLSDARSLGALGDYNDEPDRTQAEMVALFDAAITRLERGA